MNVLNLNVDYDMYLSILHFFFMMSEVVVAIQEEATLEDIFLTIYY